MKISTSIQFGVIGFEHLGENHLQQFSEFSVFVLYYNNMYRGDEINANRGIIFFFFRENYPDHPCNIFIEYPILVILHNTFKNQSASDQ